MKLICSYCQVEMGEKPPLEDERVTHTICKSCHSYFIRQWTGLQLGEYLDQFQEPVIVVDADGRVLAANQPMADLLGKSRREVSGLLGGEAMECVYARLPGGCGRTTHCKTCAIRNTVTTTHETGIPQSRVPAYLDQDDGRTRFLISSRKVAGTVLVIIEEIEPPAGSRSIRSA